MGQEGKSLPFFMFRKSIFTDSFRSSCTSTRRLSTDSRISNSNAMKDVHNLRKIWLYYWLDTCIWFYMYMSTAWFANVHTKTNVVVPCHHPHVIATFDKGPHHLIIPILWHSCNFWHFDWLNKVVHFFINPNCWIPVYNSEREPTADFTELLSFY